MMKDKLDEINILNYYKRNIIKWWSINTCDYSDYYVVGKDNPDIYIQEEEDTSELGFEHESMMVAQGLSSDELELLDSITNEYSTDHVYENVKNSMDMDLENSSVDQSVLDEANAIFARLQAEAAQDEAMKQSEIDAALAALSGN